ncbi:MULTISPECIES: OmpP1/FadL family transporter [Marichromatium]|uniref:Hydrocarbon degradation protein n=1 Tax=Marichromatium gracile TaxID=1048 RepID=A0A4R4A6M3_MARGR|nr:MULTISPECIES: outer membrane protein transport protein [Marichromatium]MBO8084712.1 outer membrane protein transport protein [Marichromatium sp.]KXX64529.1 hydrocarbon degradation protein [Marichromatium gracile]MBK1708609.1 hydrocarbon degradation protein [Marichromatium gracile]RNE93555.1 hydrocarbon degradation protein [Marichromatium sp. AB32]TCW34462.1 long-chain fatty acid transport protein [Marichromatium gracile]
MGSAFRGALVASVVLGGLPTLASATNGYFSHGWGARSKAMAGVATALPQDGLAAATNPAGMAFVGEGFDIGVAFFHPSPRGYEANPDFAVDPATGFPTGPFVTPGDYDSDADWFLIPSFGYNRPLGERATIGVSIFGNGGMNTRYRDRAVWENFAAAPDQLAGVPGAGQIASPGGLLFLPTNPPQPVTDPSVPPPPAGNNANPGGYFTATTPTGVSLEQLFIEIPYTYRFAGGRQALGIAPVFAIQRFEAEGLEPFRGASVAPDRVTNNGEEWSYGAGLHLGWYGQVNERLALGASYRTRIYMTDFDDYEGLFAGGGEFDIPAMLNLGLSYRPWRDLTLAFDYQRIFYGDIDAIANSNARDISACFAPGTKPSYCLGGDNGVGFGWETMDVFKFGVRYDVDERLSLMGGVSYNSDFTDGSMALFNILTPATVRWHLTLGASYQASDRDRFTLAVSYMPEEQLDGANPSITQDQTGSLYMQQLDIEIAWSRRF